MCDERERIVVGGILEGREESESESEKGERERERERGVREREKERERERRDSGREGEKERWKETLFVWVQYGCDFISKMPKYAKSNIEKQLLRNK